MGRFLAETCNFQNVLTYDMGGTSVDIGVIPERKIATTSEKIIADQKLAIETMDITSIGAGGGSIAWIDDLGLLRVGPSSAGAEPGPACYGKGGQNPTVTDANVILGYIPADFFLGGSISLDQSLAERVVEDHVAKPLRIDTVEAAYSISSVVEANMSERIFLSIVEKGYDPRDFVLVVGGGAGPVHAMSLAATLGMKQAYIPKHAAVFSAFGGTVADFGYILNRFFLRRDDELDLEQVKGIYDSLEGEAVEILARQGVSEENMVLMRGAEMRYFGQLRDINVIIGESKRGEPFTEGSLQALVQTFHDRHRSLYGWGDPALPSTIATLKMHAVGKRPLFALAKQPSTTEDVSGAVKRERQVYFKGNGGFVATPCYDGDRLSPGHVIKGPAIIEETKTTVVVPPGGRIEVDIYGNYVAEL